MIFTRCKSWSPASLLIRHHCAAHSSSHSACSRAEISLKPGRCSGMGCQQSRMRAASAAGVWAGMSGRRPRSITASAAWIPFRPAYGTCTQQKHDYRAPPRQHTGLPTQGVCCACAGWHARTCTEAAVQHEQAAGRSQACMHGANEGTEVGACLARGALPEHDAKGVDVGLLAVALICQHFWRHPLKRAQPACARSMA